MLKTHLLFLLSLISLITSCVGDKPQLSSISKIAADIETSQNFPGGVMVVGVREDAPGRVTFSSSDGSNLSLNIDRGDWTFYGVGYSGDVDGNGLYDENFVGTKSCSTKTMSFRGGAASRIFMDFHPDNCSGKLARSLNFKTVTAHTCPAFYDYDSSTDTFNVATDWTPAVTCSNLPREQQSDARIFKFVALNYSGSGTSVAFSTPCRSSGAGSISLPTSLVAIGVRIYRSVHECNEDLAPHNSINLVRGITEGNPDNLSHFVKETSATAVALIVPEALTKRFKSPFMDEVPRIKCEGNADCTVDPLLSFHHYVPFSAKIDNKLIWSNYPGKSCSELSFDSKFFSITNCEVKNRHVYASLSRNSISCQPAAGYVGTFYKDLYTRPGMFYTLGVSNGNTYVMLASSQGEYQNTVIISNDATFTSFAVTERKEIFAISPTMVKRFTPDSAGVYPTTPSATYPFGGTHIEVSPDGKYMFIGLNVAPTTQPNSVIETRLTSDGSLLDSENFFGTIRQLQLVGNDLYSLEFWDEMPYNPPYVPTIDAGIIRRTTFSHQTGSITPQAPHYVPGGLFGPSGLPGMVSNGYFLHNFHVNGDEMFTVVHSSTDTLTWPAGVTTLRRNTTTNTWQDHQGPYSSPEVAHAHRIDNKTYTISLSGEIRFFHSTASWTNQTVFATCNENITLYMGNRTRGLNLTTNETTLLSDNHKKIFETGMKLAGKKTFIDNEYNFFTFDYLNEEQQKNTSGGKVNRVQRILGPHGLGGMLHDFNDCSDVRSAVNVAPISRSYAVDDPYTGYKSYRISIRPYTAEAYGLICKDDPAGTCESYEMVADVRSTGLLENESYELKFKCDSKLGELNYKKTYANETKRELIYWNTNLLNHQRAEVYESLITPASRKVELSLIQKYGISDLWARNLSFTKTSKRYTSYNRGYQRSSTNHMLASMDYSGTPAAYPLLPTYSSNKTVVNLTGEPDICLDIASRFIFASLDTTTCDLINQVEISSRGIPFSLQAMEEAEEAGSAFHSFFTR